MGTPPVFFLERGRLPVKIQGHFRVLMVAFYNICSYYNLESSVRWSHNNPHKKFSCFFFSVLPVNMPGVEDTETDEESSCSQDGHTRM